MALESLFSHHIICGKDVYVVDDHHHALAPWALIRRRLAQAPNLITIDHHTDVHEAFLGHAHLETYESGGDAWDLAKELVDRIDRQDNQSLLWAIERLRHDEHIDAATLSGILSYAFCIQLSDSGGNPPIIGNTYADPPNHIFVISHDCAIGCTRMPHNDDCVVEHGNMIIESIYLDDQMVRGAEMSRCVGIDHLESQPYILDIDLDAFHSRQAIEPADRTTFYRLIRNAVAITVATEAECVDELKFDGETIDADFLLVRLVDHIKAAIG